MRPLFARNGGGNRLLADMDVILTVAYGKICDYPTYRAFLNSFQAIRRADLKLVAFGGKMSRSARRATESVGAEIHEPGDRFNDPGNKQRHWHFAEYLGRRRDEPGYVLTVDSRDTIFQHDPFSFAPLRSGARILLSAESCLVKADTWNLQDQTAFQSAIRPACRRGKFQNWPVVNGGFVAGTIAAMADFQLTRFALDVREGEGTDQGSLGVLANWIREWPGYRTVGDNEPWVLHGHWLDSSPQAVADANGFAVVRATGEAYRVFHQWERTECLERLLKKFG
jgi:hypothetical protein